MLENKQSKNLVLERKKLHEMNIIYLPGFLPWGISEQQPCWAGKEQNQAGEGSKKATKY